MKILVGVPCAEAARFSLFYDGLMHVAGVTKDNVCVVRGSSIAKNRNVIAQQAIAGGFDAVWYVDDDQAILPDTLERLAAHDKDIVSGLYLSREVPFRPHVYRDGEDGCSEQLQLPPQGGLFSPHAVGAGCLLVKTGVFSAMGQPWWRLGQISSETWGDDLDFCRRARDVGFEVWCDLDCQVGHLVSPVVVWPSLDGTGWKALLAQEEKVLAQWNIR